MQGIVIAGTHSGCGKTTITLGIMAALLKKGLAVQPFKTGPDFIDTGLHRLITGRSSRNLDLWMCGKDYAAECFRNNSVGADISVIEGVMGMYDGNHNTADLAEALGLPVILVVDAYGMAESAGAVVKGFQEFHSEHRAQNTEHRQLISGVIFNCVASERHWRRLKDSVKDVPVLGYLPRDLDFQIPHRHLGLVVAEENPMDKKEIDKLADAVLEYIDTDHIAQMSGIEEERNIGRRGLINQTPTVSPGVPSSRLKIAVAYDRAFCFYYEDNLDMLEKAGAEIIRFSPLSDSTVPEDAGAVYLGGGYPELNAEALSNNKSMLKSVKDFSDSGKPVYGECGGFMYLTEGIYDLEDRYFPMSGIFPFSTKMRKGRSRLGYREAELLEDTLLGSMGDKVRGHEFHYSEIMDSHKRSAVSLKKPETVYALKDGEGNSIGCEGYRAKNTLGSYVHLHFGSNRKITNKFIDFIKEHHGTDTVSRTR